MHTLTTTQKHKAQTLLYTHKLNNNVTSLEQSIATKQAIQFSMQYGTFWYVRKIGENKFAPYAHSCNTENTVACFYNGEDWTNV